MSSASLVVNFLTLSYGDVPLTSNPMMKYVDWQNNYTVNVNNPRSDTYVVAPGASQLVFNGIASTSLDNTTEFQLTLNPAFQDRYRFTWDGTGTNPAFRTQRTVAVSGQALTLVLNSNQTLTVSAVPTFFVNVVVGDIAFIPGVSTGDTASPFNVINEGYWIVIGKAVNNSNVQLSRLPSASFSGISEVVTPSSNSQFIFYSASGIQIGNSVNISAGFSSAVQNTYSIVAVTPTWFEVISTLPLPVTQTAIPGTAGMQFFLFNKRFLRIEVDQASFVQLNGDTGNTNRLVPWVAGDLSQSASYVKTGPCWSLSITNSSIVPMNVLVISAE